MKPILITIIIFGLIAVFYAYTTGEVVTGLDSTLDYYYYR